MTTVHDTTSALFIIGERTAFTKLLQNQETLATLATMGMSRDITKTFGIEQQYILMLYGAKARQYSTLDELRYQFGYTSDKPGCSFPPTDDSFKQHFLRVNFQVAIWILSHLPKPLLWKPAGNGWKISSGGHLVEVLFQKEPAPVELREITHLYCTDSDCNQSKKCHCIASGLSCTQFCTCGVTEECRKRETDVLVDDSDDDAGKS